MIIPVSADVCVPIRQAVLRPELDRKASMYALDLAPTTLHFGWTVDGTTVGVVTVGRDASEDAPVSPDRDLWRIKGMAVLEPHRNQGIGAQLLSAARAGVANLAARDACGVPVLWARARAQALQFYLREGMVAVSEERRSERGNAYVVVEQRLAPFVTVAPAKRQRAPATG